MPYDSYGNYVPSKADKTTDVFGYDAIFVIGDKIKRAVTLEGEVGFGVDYTRNILVEIGRIFGGIS